MDEYETSKSIVVWSNSMQENVESVTEFGNHGGEDGGTKLKKCVAFVASRQLGAMVRSLIWAYLAHTGVFENRNMIWSDLRFENFPTFSQDKRQMCSLQGWMMNQGRLAGDASWVLFQISGSLRATWFLSCGKFSISLSWVTWPTHKPSCTTLDFPSLEGTLSAVNNISLPSSPV